MFRTVFFVMAVIIFLTGMAWADWDSYTPGTLQQVVTVAKQAAAEKDRVPGTTFWNKSYVIPFTMRSYPVKNKTTTQGKVLFLYQKTMGITDDLNTVFNHVLETSIDDMRVVLLFQDVLVPYLKEEIGPGVSVHLYVLMGVYSDFDRTVYLLVNEFQRVEK